MFYDLLYNEVQGGGLSSVLAMEIPQSCTSCKHCASVMEKTQSFKQADMELIFICISKMVMYLFHNISFDIDCVNYFTGSFCYFYTASLS